MGKLIDPLTGIWWFDRTNEITAAEAAKEKLRHARAFDVPLTEYISAGSSWSLYNGTAPIMRTLTLTQGAHTTLTATDSRGNTYATGEAVVDGEAVTHEAVAHTGCTITTFTVGGVDKKSTNPFTAAIGGNLTVESAATVNTYAYTETEGGLGTIVLIDADEQTVSAGSAAVTHFAEYTLTVTPTDIDAVAVTVTNGGVAVPLTKGEAAYTATITCAGILTAKIEAITYAYTATTNTLGTIALTDASAQAVSAGATALTRNAAYTITVTPTDETTSVVTVTHGGASVELAEADGVYTAEITCKGAIVAVIAAAPEES